MAMEILLLFFPYEHCSNRDIKGETAMKAVTLASFHRNRSQISHQEAGDHAYAAWRPCKARLLPINRPVSPSNPIAADLCSSESM